MYRSACEKRDQYVLTLIKISFFYHFSYSIFIVRFAYIFLKYKYHMILVKETLHDWILDFVIFARTLAIDSFQLCYLDSRVELFPDVLPSFCPFPQLETHLDW